MSGTPRAGARIALLLAWLAALAVAGAWLGRGLHMEEDLRRFLPTPRTPAQVLLVDELGEGPGSRVLLLALSGAAPEALAARSQALRLALAARPEIALASNGDGGGLEAVPDHLRPYRYLLSPTLDAQPLDEAFLRDELQQRVQERSPRLFQHHSHRTVTEIASQAGCPGSDGFRRVPQDFAPKSLAVEHAYGMFLVSPVDAHERRELDPWLRELGRGNRCLGMVSH